MQKYSLGIDVGTTNVKAVLVSAAGEIAATSSVAYPTRYPAPGQAEQAASDWWKAAVDAIGGITSKISFTASKNELGGIYISSHAPTLMPLDELRRPLRNGLIWMDNRGQGVCRQVSEQIGRERYLRITGANPEDYYLLPRLCWFKSAEPELYAQTRSLLQANGYLIYKMTGEMTIDANHVTLTHCYDYGANGWSKDIQEAAGIPFADWMPPVRRCEETAGVLSSKAASVLGLPKGTPVLSGSTDSYASCMAIGLQEPGDSSEMTGTSTLIFISHHTKPDNAWPLLNKMCPVPAIPALLMAPISTTGASLDWFVKHFGYESLASASREGISGHMLANQAIAEEGDDGGLLFFPYMMGERAPLWNPYSRGMLIGLTLDTKPADIGRAILTGTSFAVKHIFHEAQKLGVQIKRVNCAGGGAKSDIWLKIKASVFNMPVHVLSGGADRAALGGAMIAGRSLGLLDQRALEKLVRVERVVEPVKDWAIKYEELFPFYLHMYRHLDADLKRLWDTTERLRASQSAPIIGG